MPDTAYRMAAIDVGTNSIHMIVVESQRHGYRVIDKEKEPVQLGRNSLGGKPLTANAIERGVATLRTMTEIARRWNVTDIVAVATSAVREAPNQDEFLSAAEMATGLRLRVISGEEEADYIYRAVRAAVDFHGGTALTIDIGGGSVELIAGTSEEVFFTHSEPAGALRIAQRFRLDRPARDGAIDECRAYVRKKFKRTAAEIRARRFDFCIGTSGTILSLAALSSLLGNGGQSPASGLRWLSRSRLREIIEMLEPFNAADRARRFALEPMRAETILAGAIVLDEIMSALEIEQLRACDAALREGIVEQVLSDREEKPSTGSVREAAVLALAERAGVDVAHASHVSRLALRIFDQSEDLHRLRVGERELLEYAALLHEVGMHVSFQDYHKHSYYLISHAGLRGFTPDQVAIVANVARYVRKTPPRDEHENFSQLSKWQKDIVRKLASILRIADGLDRGRQGIITDVALDVLGETVKFRLHPRAVSDVEIASAARRGKYFDKLFGRSVNFELNTR